MKLYFAPLEGITTSVYRNAHFEMFGGCDEYYAPFITPSDNEKITRKGLKDIFPEENRYNLKIQVLANKSEAFLKFEKKVASFGYDEININLGCPSSTVVKKGRGSGFLRERDALDNFLYEIFSQTNAKISIKTRTGFESGNEMDELMEIYNKYPLSLLIIHPRARSDFYKGEPDMDIFKKAYQKSKNKVCYNGNVFNASDFEDICKKYPDIDSVMLGRGAIVNPAIFRELKGGKKITTDELIEFSMLLLDRYNAVLRSDTYTLNKLKELWLYGMWNYPEEKKILKAIKKSDKLSDIVNAINLLPERDPQVKIVYPW